MTPAIQNPRRLSFIGAILIGIAAIFCRQPDVPVLQSPDFRYVSSTEIVLTAGYAVTSTVDVVEFEPGFRSDGMSIPRAATTPLGLNPFSGCAINASLYHDACYRGHLMPRDRADLGFYVIAIRDGMAPAKARAAYQALRDFGAKAYDAATPESIANSRRFVRLRGTTDDCK